MKVYILMKGYDYEGESVLKVFDSKEKAEELEVKYSDMKERGVYYYVEEWEVEQEIK